MSFLVFSCVEKSQPHEVNVSFYHWQSDLNISPIEKSTLEQLAIEKIYLRFFDLDWSSQHNGIVPVGELQIDSTLPSNLQIVPTIFITNRSFTHLNESKLPDLIQKTTQKIKRQLKELGVIKIHQLQMDCDWSGSTRDIYFQFLKMLQPAFPEVELSATIRLHQIKYREQTGVPPVARGILMFYNMGDLENPETLNSIYDWSIAQPYLDRLPRYPLVLDLALPLFSWGVLFRNGEMIKLINNLRREDLLDQEHFKFLDALWVEVVKSTYIQGYYLYKGDRLRLESVESADLIYAAGQLGKKINNQKLDLVYYHLDSNTLKHYSYAQFQKIRQAVANQ